VGPSCRDSRDGGQSMQKRVTLCLVSKNCDIEGQGGWVSGFDKGGMSRSPYITIFNSSFGANN
jgi:hypothetical protein